MSGCCLAALDGLPVVPSLAFADVSLMLARHWAGGSLNDGYVTGRYRLRLMEQILIIWGIVEFNAPAQAPGKTSVPYATAMFASVVPSTPSTAICSGLPVRRGPAILSPWAPSHARRSRAHRSGQRQSGRLAVEAWNKRRLGFSGTGTAIADAG
jgi:hypothetical protein